MYRTFRELLQPQLDEPSAINRFIVIVQKFPKLLINEVEDMTDNEMILAQLSITIEILNNRWILH